MFAFLLPYRLCGDSSHVSCLQTEISAQQQDADKCWLVVPDYLSAIHFLMSSSGSEMRGGKNLFDLLQTISLV